MFCVEQWASVLLVFLFLAFRTGVKKVWLWFVLRWPCAMVQSWYGGWHIWVYTESACKSHVVLLYEWLQNFETKEPIRREWCKLLKKARTAYPSATTMLAVAQLKMSFLCEKTRITWKQHVENSQMYDKNSTSFWRCKILTWLPEKHITISPVREITLERMTDTRKPSKTLKPLKNKLPTNHIFSVHRSVCYGQILPIFRDKEITSLRKKYETGTFHASSL